jgi:hypothetical protein
MEPLGVEFRDEGPDPAYRVPRELALAIQQDGAFREYHLDHCGGCFPEERTPRSWSVKVRPSGQVTRSVSPGVKHPWANAHTEPVDLIKVPADLYDQLGLDGMWRRWPYPITQPDMTDRPDLLGDETEAYWAPKRALMAEHVAENPWWGSEFFRLRSVAADHEFLSAHFAECEPWRSGSRDLHPPFRNLLGNQYLGQRKTPFHR